jgi:hypothetical protein
VTGVDAALGIDDIPDKLVHLVKGYRDPSDYFDLFRNSLLRQKDSYGRFKRQVGALYDDHEQLRKGQGKARFCADRDGSRLALNALALNATTLGIPCIYYWSEQCLDGNGASDRYIREAMFGGEFGAFRSRHRHSSTRIAGYTRSSLRASPSARKGSCSGRVASTSARSPATVSTSGSSHDRRPDPLRRALIATLRRRRDGARHQYRPCRGPDRLGDSRRRTSRGKRRAHQLSLDGADLQASPNRQGFRITVPAAGFVSYEERGLL